MGPKYLIDTNAISDYLGAIVTPKALDFMDEIIDNFPTISVINRIELLGHNRPEHEKFKLIVSACIVYELTEEIILKTIILRKSRKIKLPDAIIAATALTHNLTLITHNLTDFENIQNLNILDLHSM